MLFHEAGTWQPDSGSTIPFRNVFRWTKQGEQIRLEHLRLSPDAPVFLFDLARQTDGRWGAVDPHRCKADRYAASLTRKREGIDLVWRISGPKKQERIVYRYAS